MIIKKHEHEGIYANISGIRLDSAAVSVRELVYKSIIMMIFCSNHYHFISLKIKSDSEQ